MEETVRSRSFLATSRTPPIFTDGSVSAAIQRLTVLTDTPAQRAMSPARKKSGTSVISDPRCRLALVGSHLGVEGKFAGSLTRQQTHERNQRVGPP